MAAANEGEFPLLRFYFRVEIDGNPISFQEVTGLEMEVETVPYRHGDSENFYSVNIPGLVKFPPLVCKKGIIEDDEELMDFMVNMIEEKEYYDPENKFDISIEMLNPEEETVLAWLVEGAIPRKLSTPGFNSTANEIAIEEMEFIYDSIKISTDGA